MIKHVIKRYVSILLIISTLTTLPLVGYAQPTDSPTIGSESAILIDAKTGEILYEKNAYEQHYPASITKLMTALLAIENLKPTDVISFSQDAIYGIESGSSNIGMKVGEQITVDQALHALMLESANEVANGLAEKISGSVDQFAIKMTERAKELGAKNTHFVNPHGLPDDNHYTTAYDMALITKALYNNDYFLDIMATPTYSIPSTNKSNDIRRLSQQHGFMNKIRNSKMFREDVIGGKTGYTDVARHTLVTVVRRGDIDLIVVIMKGEKQSIYEDTSALLDFGFNNYQPLVLHKPGDVLLNLPIYSIKSGKLYEAGTCDISVTNDQSILAPKSVKSRELQTSLDLPEYLDLSIKEGTQLGTITYSFNNKIIADNQLVASKVHFKPSPQKVTAPPAASSSLSFRLSGWVILGAIIISLIVLFLLKRPKKPKFKHKKLRFSKTIK